MKKKGKLHIRHLFLPSLLSLSPPHYSLLPSPPSLQPPPFFLSPLPPSSQLPLHKTSNQKKKIFPRFLFLFSFFPSLFFVNHTTNDLPTSYNKSNSKSTTLNANPNPNTDLEKKYSTKYVRYKKYKKNSFERGRGRGGWWRKWYF